MNDTSHLNLSEIHQTWTSWLESKRARTLLSKPAAERIHAQGIAIINSDPAGVEDRTLQSLYDEALSRVTSNSQH